MHKKINESTGKIAGTSNMSYSHLNRFTHLQIHPRFSSVLCKISRMYVIYIYVYIVFFFRKHFEKVKNQNKPRHTKITTTLGKDKYVQSHRQIDKRGRASCLSHSQKVIPSIKMVRTPVERTGPSVKLTGSD